MKMMFWCMGAVASALAVSAPLAIVPTVAGGVGVGGFSTVSKAADEVVSLRWKDSSGANQSESVATGQQGTGNGQDDLPKGMTPEDKAARLRDAINGAGWQGVNAVASGSVVTVTAPQGVTGFTVTNNTKEKNNFTSVHSATCDGNPSTYDCGTATMQLSGIASGFDDDGAESMIMFGTKAASVTIALKPGDTAFSVAETLSSMLNPVLRLRRPVYQMAVPTAWLKIAMNENDHAVVYGITDTGLVQTVGASAP